MRAWVLEDIEKFELHSDIANPVAGPGEVVVKIKAAGICGSDIQRVYENGAHNMPLIIGHEFAGEVVSDGDAANNTSVADAWVGKRVGVFPLIPCKKCPQCLEKQYEMCTGYNYLGSRCNGGFAEYVAVPKWNLIELSDNVTYEQAAMLEPMAVTVHAIRHMSIDGNKSVAVCGLGTIGKLAIRILESMGVNNIYPIGKDTDVNAIKMETDGQGVDIYFDCVGKNETILQGIELTRPGGEICLMGNPYSDVHMDRDIYWAILRHQLTLKGTWNSSFYGESDPESQYDDWHFIMEKLQEGLIDPEELITHRFEMDELDKGFEIMREKLEKYTKIMMVM